MMKKEYKLAVCIPNYNRPEKLKELLELLVKQIEVDELHTEVEICINDDNSSETPDEIIEKLRKKCPEVKIEFYKNTENRGMDYNFLRCVMISSGEYCWIVGNDDTPEPEALKTILRYIKDGDIDILVSPFDVYDDNDIFVSSINPLRIDDCESRRFHSDDAGEYDDLIERVQSGDALFCFLSNVVFKKARWVEHGSRFDDKMDTIFIQMYMNIQTLKESAVYLYVQDKIIRNHADPSVNDTYKREYDILTGLNGVVDYFFEGKHREKLKECIVDPRINGRMWGIPDAFLVDTIAAIKSVKNEFYKRYFISPKERENRFKGRNIILYGAGYLGNKAMEELSEYAVKSLSIYDSDSKKWGKVLAGCKINRPDKLYEEYRKNQSIVVVANNLALVEIINMLLETGVDDIALIN